MELKWELQDKGMVDIGYLLIAPLMELKLCLCGRPGCSGHSFNRTAYGIEITIIKADPQYQLNLLIAPLMELKFNV